MAGTIRTLPGRSRRRSPGLVADRRAGPTVEIELLRATMLVLLTLIVVRLALPAIIDLAAAAFR